MPIKPGFNVTSGTLFHNLALFEVRANVAIAAATREFAAEIEEWMKEHAVWQDRTGDARSGLTAEHKSEGFKQSIYLYYSVDYGYWLEVIQSGRLSILKPTIEHFQPEALRHFDRATMGGGSGYATIGAGRGIG